MFSPLKVPCSPFEITVESKHRNLCDLHVYHMLFKDIIDNQSVGTNTVWVVHGGSIWKVEDQNSLLPVDGTMQDLRQDGEEWFGLGALEPVVIYVSWVHAPGQAVPLCLMVTEAGIEKFAEMFDGGGTLQ